MKKNYFTVNIIDKKHGYSFMVNTDLDDEDEVLDACVEAGYFEEPEDANHCVVDSASQHDNDAFTNFNAIREL